MENIDFYLLVSRSYKYQQQLFKIIMNTFMSIVLMHYFCLLLLHAVRHSKMCYIYVAWLLGMLKQERTTLKDMW